MANLLDSVKEYITPELISMAAKSLDESEGGVNKAILGLAPTILAGILNKNGDSNAMGSIFNMLSKFDSGVLGQLGNLVGQGNLAHNDPKDEAGHFLGTLFGSKVPAITNAVSAYSGVKSSSTSSLLGLVGPLVMGLLSKRINTGGLNVSGLMSLLNGEKSSILGALPTGLGSVLGLSVPGVDAAAATTGTSSSGDRGWLWPLLLLVGLGAGIMYYMKNCSSKPVEKPVAETTAPVAEPTPVVETPKAKVELTAGTQEYDMQAFIMSADSIDKNKWFNFPEIQFDVNKATIKPESEAKLNSVLAILKAYPAVKVKIGGYTDSDGDDKKNLKLSGERAKSVTAWLVEKGIAADRLDPEGYGEQHPVAPNDSPENKAKNRRISFSVRAK